MTGKKAVFFPRVSLAVRATREASKDVASELEVDPDDVSCVVPGRCPLPIIVEKAPPDSKIAPAIPPGKGLENKLPVMFCIASFCLLPKVLAFAVTQTHNVG